MVGAVSMTGLFAIGWMAPLLGAGPAAAGWLLAHEDLNAIRLGAIAAEATKGTIVRISPGLFQPIAADDVAAAVADVAVAAPRNGIVEIAGPERAPFYDIVARYLKAIGDPRTVVSDPEARYFGGRVDDRSLVPLGEARLGRIVLDEWLRRSQHKA